MKKLTKKQVGKLILAACKKQLWEQGQHTSDKYFPDDYPVTRRTLYNIANGMWTESILEKLPIKVKVTYNVQILPMVGITCTTAHHKHKS